MNNYFGIGLDAKISLDFNNKRDEHPEKCRWVLLATTRLQDAKQKAGAERGAGRRGSHAGGHLGNGLTPRLTVTLPQSCGKGRMSLMSLLSLQWKQVVVVQTSRWGGAGL